MDVFHPLLAISKFMATDFKYGVSTRIHKILIVKKKQVPPPVAMIEDELKL